MKTVVVVLVVQAFSGILAKVKYGYTCPNAFVRFKTDCFLFSKVEVTWEEASLDCYDRGGHLAIMDRPDVKIFLMTMARFRRASFWIDGNDRKTEGHWVWQSSQEPIKKFFWDEIARQPDGDTKENCVALLKSRRGHYFKWYDMDCMERLFYICQRN